MSTAKIIKLVSSIVMVTCVAAMVLTALPATGEKPKLQCVEPGAPSSGFSDPNQDNCPVSAQSVREVRKWEKGLLGESTYTVRRVTAVIFVLALIGLVTGVVVGRRTKKPAAEQE